MASLHKDIPLDAHPDDVWSAVRDFGALHTRLVPGFVTDTQLDGDARIVTFANGSVAREQLVDCDETRRRLVYAIANERMSHYSASVQVFSDGDARSRLVWTVDLLPQRNRALCRRPDGSGRAGDAENVQARRGMSVCPFLDALGADGPAADRAGKMDLYGRFVGSWDLDVMQLRDDGTKRGARANGISAGRWRAAPSRTSGSCRRAANCAVATPPPMSIPMARRCGSTIPGSMPGRSDGPIR